MLKRWSTKRTLRQVERVVESLGFDRFEDLEVHGYTLKGASSYIEFNPLGLTIRVSDHPQPFNGKWGGYDVERGREARGGRLFHIPRRKKGGRVEMVADQPN